jgi:hypothetical protein
MDMSEVILNSVARKKRSNNLCSTREEDCKNNLKIIYDFCELRVGRGWGGCSKHRLVL